MRRDRVHKLRLPPVLSWRDWGFTLVPALAWALLVRSRAWLISPHCVNEPLKCVAANLFFLDRYSLGVGYPAADSLSFTTQYAAAWFACLVPLIWLMTRKLSAFKKLRIAGTDLLLFLETTLWNGLLTESIRVIVQRPRPFVYSDPSHLGIDPAHYTSFISGHTSFAAAASTSCVLVLLGRQAPQWLVTLTLVTGTALIISTGVFRVLAGRHFPTDVLFAAVAGITASLCVALIHKPRNTPQIVETS